MRFFDRLIGRAGVDPEPVHDPDSMVSEAPPTTESLPQPEPKDSVPWEDLLNVLMRRKLGLYSVMSLLRERQMLDDISARYLVNGDGGEKYEQKEISVSELADSIAIAVTEIRKIAELRVQSQLTKEEYAAAKKKILFANLPFELATLLDEGKIIQDGQEFGYGLLLS